MKHHDDDLIVGEDWAKKIVLDLACEFWPFLEPNAVIITGDETDEVERLFDRKENTVAVLKRYRRRLNTLIDQETDAMSALYKQAEIAAADRVNAPPADPCDCEHCAYVRSVIKPKKA